MDESRLPKGIMLSDTDNFGHSYRLECSCYDPYHDFSFNIEWDRESNDISFVIYANLYTQYFPYYKIWFFEKFYNIIGRIRLALKILFLGYYETQGCFTFKDSEQVNAFMEAMELSRQDVAKSGRAYGDWLAEKYSKGKSNEDT